MARRTTQRASAGASLSSLAVSSSAARDDWTARDVVFWVALGVALSASWAELATHWAAEPWARPSAFFLPLAVAAALREPWRREPRPLPGGLLIAAGLAATLLAIGGGLARAGRPGIPVACIGMALALGRPSLPVAMIVLWAIPPPYALAKALAPGLEHLLGELAAGAARAAGLSATLGPAALAMHGAELPLAPTDGGLPAVFYLAGIGWWSAVRGGCDARRAIRAALRMAPFGLAAQSLCLALAFALLAARSPGPARALLDASPGLAIAAALLWVWRSRPALESERAAQGRP